MGLLNICLWGFIALTGFENKESKNDDAFQTELGPA